MDYAAAAEALMRRRLLESIYDRMTDEEKKLFAQMTMQQKSTDEILSALRQQQLQLADIKQHQQTFAQDFASNIAGNAVWDGLLWLTRRLFK
jgi:hypothetical protein